MDDARKRLETRLTDKGHPPDFSGLFKQVKRPPHTIRKGTIIFNEGDPLGRIYLIKTGFVKLYRLSEEGRETTSYLLGPGYIMGVRALLSEDECAKHNAEALTDVSIQTMARKEYLDVISDHPEFVTDLIHVFIDRLTYTERKLEGFIFASTTVRVANFLADTARRFGEKKDGAIMLPLKLTHQRIAEFVGAFRETVTVSLNRLEDEKIVEIHDNGKIVIASLKRLEQYAMIGKKHR